MSQESYLGGWQDVPIRITVIGKVKEIMPHGKSALVEVSGAQFMATYDPTAVGCLAVGCDVLIDEEYASIVGPAPRASRDGRRVDL